MREWNEDVFTALLLVRLELPWRTAFSQIGELRTVLAVRRPTLLLPGKGERLVQPGVGAEDGFALLEGKVLGLALGDVDGGL